MRSIEILASLAMAFCLAGCGGNSAPQIGQVPAANAAGAGSMVTTGATADDPSNTVIVELKTGKVTIRLRPDLAPKHVERVKMLVNEGFYNGLKFHRVIPGFMAQTGDGDRGDGRGKSKYPNIKAEFSKVPFKRGVVGMARASDPDSGNCQFFITFDDAPHLNGQYTVIGEVTSGMDNVDKIKKGEPVVDPDRIVRAFVQADGKK
jgi:peptidylprolyl isomerase